MAHNYQQDDFNECMFESKAVWRRQSIERMKLRRDSVDPSQCLKSQKVGSRSWIKRGAPIMTRRRCMREFLHGQKPKYQREAKVVTGQLPTTRKAERYVELSDWYRTTLSEHGNIMTLLDTEFDHGDFSPRCQRSEQGSEENDDHLAKEVLPYVSPNPLEQHAPRVGLRGIMPEHARQKPDSSDAAVQCDEPLAPSPLGQKLCRQKIDTAMQESKSCYSVASHFSLFDDASTIADYARRLEPADLTELAGRFLGMHIAGMKVARGMLPGERPSRRVAERHVLEAALLSGAYEIFRKSLLVSGNRLLLGGFTGSPLHGQGLLRVSHDYPGDWAKLAYTAMDFAGRLIKIGALPCAFAAELLAGLAEMPPSPESGRMLVLGLLIVLPAVRKPLSGPKAIPRHCPSAALNHASSGLVRTMSTPCQVRTKLTLGQSGKSQSSPAWYGCSVRTIGTCMNLQDGFQPYSFVSINQASKARPSGACEVGPPIHPNHLPDYWRFSAGGEHRQERLEKRALEAEEELI